MKRIFSAVITACLLLVTLSACGGNNDKSNSDKQTAAKTENASAADHFSGKNSDKVVVPDVNGKDKDSAKLILEEAGLIVKLQENDSFNKSIEDNQVIEQSFAAGSIVANKSTIVLTYNSSRLRMNYIDQDDSYLAKAEGKLPATISSLTFDDIYNNKPVGGFRLVTDETASIGLIDIPQNCTSVYINSPNVTIDKVIINNSKKGLWNRVNIDCKNTPIVEYTK